MKQVVVLLTLKNRNRFHNKICAWLKFDFVAEEIFVVLDKPQRESPEQGIALETQRYHRKPKDLTELLRNIVSIPSQDSFEYWMKTKGLWASINRWLENNFCRPHVDCIPQIHTILISWARFYSRVYIPDYFWPHSAWMAHWHMKPTGVNVDVNSHLSAMSLVNQALQ